MLYFGIWSLRERDSNSFILAVKREEVFQMNKVKENEWRGNPFVIIAGILVLYTASNSIITLLNL